MPTPHLEQRKVCDWIYEPRQEVVLRMDRGISSATKVSTPEEIVEAVPRPRMYIGQHLGFYSVRDEIDPEQGVWELARVARTKVAKEDYDRAAALAARLSITRSQLYSKALKDFIDRYESELLVEEVNAAYDEELEQEDEEFLRHAKVHNRRLLSAED